MSRSFARHGKQRASLIVKALHEEKVGTDWSPARLHLTNEFFVVPDMRTEKKFF